MKFCFKRSALILLLITLILFSVILFAENNGGVANAGEPFRVVIVTWPGFGPLFVAKEKGFFEDLKVEITIMDETTGRRAAFTGKKAEAIAETLDSFASVASTLGGKAVLKTDDSAGGDGIVVKKNIQKITDLKGKTVAFPQGLPSHFFLIYLLNKNGLSAKDIKPQYMEPDKAAAAFMAGKVDACVTWEPFLTQAGTSPGGKILMTTDDSQGLIFDIIVVRKDVIKNRPGDIQKFVNGWFKALEFCKKNPGEANKIMSDNLKISVEDVEAMLGGIKLADLVSNKACFGTFQKAGNFVEVFDSAGEIWQLEGLIKKILPGKEAYDTQFIQSVK
ncbi:MAG TPA: ABC transporter substrate-binding protein [Candidatus Eremiobacteraeota bacterium]|nr:MAG: putative aliphatic sulfonates-binding protein precursor [bacterium ADurb.Bin363]HPZ08604.1 ABC transporter substrate-binding protein [Candidatus Eremiobacteraeota bacterium]